MASNGQHSPRNPSTPPQSIPMQDLARPPDTASIGNEERGHNRGRTILSGGSARTSAGAAYGPRYEKLEDDSPSPTERHNVRMHPPALSRVHAARVEEYESPPHSPVGNPADFQAAMGFAGLSMGSHLDQPSRPRPLSSESIGFESPYLGTDPIAQQSYFQNIENDRIPLTDPHYLQPVGSTQNISTPRGSQDGRTSFQSIHFTPDSRHRGSRLGDNLPEVEAQHGRARGISFGESLSPDGRRGSRRNSNGESPLSRAGSIMRAMSQRVVNLSNEAEVPETAFGRKPSINDDTEDFPPIDVMEQTTAFHPDKTPTPQEKPMPLPPWPITNPFRGKSLMIFSPDNPVRISLCNLLVNPWSEPTILVLIILQTVLLAIEASQSVYLHPRSVRWNASAIDLALLALFVIFTSEVCVKIIVSGFFFNAAEYSTVDRKKGLKHTIASKYKKVFGPQRQKSVRHTRNPEEEHDMYSNSIVRSFTHINANMAAPITAAEAYRQQLARRAFFRHSMNRIDFIAIVSFWVTFGLSMIGVESTAHLFVFRMMSCLRILRLLALTSGTNIILKSLKKAAPLLVNVSFLIGFFWLLFAIVGVQAFKSSFSRQCVWIDPLGVANYTNNFTLCGGYLDKKTGARLPWVYDDGITPGAATHKGYLCPRGSLCMQQTALFNGTVSFDNIVQSLELVFVIMSANTFTDLMYYTTNSDYLAAALFFAGGIVIMMLWLTNLLIAVITSSFQVIREESKQESAFAQNAHHPFAADIELGKSQNLVKHWYDKTNWIWILVIVYGLICQSIRSSSMSPFRATFIDTSEVVVTLLLLVEIIIRIAGDFRRFHKRKRNLFDLGLAIITTVILLPPIRNSTQAYAWLTVFQILRVYRIVWAVPITRDLIQKVLGNASGIGNLVLFIFLITFLMAILATQLFRGEIPEFDENSNRIEITFFTIYNAFLGMYQILSSENWTTLLYNVTTYEDHLNTGWIGATFLIGWFILSFFILVNMFIAVIQENFDVSEDEKRLQQVKAFLQRKEVASTSSNLALSTIFRFGRARKTKDPLDYGKAAMEMLLKDAVVRDFLDEEMDPLQQNTDTLETTLPNQKAPRARRSFIHNTWNKFLTRVWNREPNPFYSSITFTGTNETLDARTMAREAVSATAQRKKLQRDFLARHPNYNKALFIFKPDNPIRRICQKIVGPGRGSERFEGVEPNKVVWYIFSAFIYAAVVTMVVLACVTTPLYQREFFQDHEFTIKNWFVWTDLAFAAVFTVEAIIKIIADGCFWTPNAYLRSLWGFIDGLVLITLWVNVITSFMNDGAVSRAVGAFKALRALRLLNVSDSAKETFHSLIFVGGWRVISAAFVSLSLLIPFAIYGVNLFNGQLEYCNDTGSGIVNLSDCVGEYGNTPYSNNWPMLSPRVVSNPYYDFDNFGDALFILFQIVSQEGWVDVMWAAESIVGPGVQPRAYASQGNAMFFVIFNLMATVFVLTLFISVFMRTYTEQTGVAFLTAEQRSWMELRKLLRRVNPSKRPSNKASPKWKLWCYKRATRKHGRWHQGITAILVIHLILLMMEYYGEPLWWEETRSYIFLVFTIIYVVNIVVRINGLSWPRFSRSSWDIFSLFAVTGSLITSILVLADINSTAYARTNKLFLVSIALLLIPRNNALDQLFKTAAASLTNIGNLLATWFVLFLVFAIAMTQTFGLTRFGGQGTNNLNFRDVPKALIVLFRMSVGEGWNQIMEDYATIQPPMCTDSENFFESDCGSNAWAKALFIAWNILSMYIFVSLFVSLIYESFSYVYQRSSGLSIVSREEIRRFKQAWSLFDPHGTGYISKEQFPRLLGELSGVFGMRIYDEQDSVRRILEDVQLQDRGSRVGSIATVSQSTGLDLKKLNSRIATINSKEVRARRHRYNMFYQEVMVSSDPDRGIGFTGVLMILAHYNVISDSKSLKLDEFLRRRARLQKVEEEAQRRVVVGFFDTVYWHRKFRRHLDRHKQSRMVDIPSFAVPEIIVDDDDDHDDDEDSKKALMGQTARASLLPSAAFSDGNPFHTSFGFEPQNNTSYDSYRHRRGTDASEGPRGSLGAPSATSSPNRSPRLSPHRPTNSANSFDIDIEEPTSSAGNSRRGSAVSAENVLEVFQDSAWGESLRRSFTTKRPGSHQP